jgi:hypothetical protein
MTPTMLSGDIVLIDRRQCVVDHAHLIWAFTFGGMGMIKRIGAARDGQVKILSDNPRSPPISPPRMNCTSSAALSQLSERCEEENAHIANFCCTSALVVLASSPVEARRYHHPHHVYHVHHGYGPVGGRHYRNVDGASVHSPMRANRRPWWSNCALCGRNLEF